MTADSDNGQVPKAAREVLELYETRADTLCFPDVDAPRLRDLQQQMQHTRASVDDAQAALAAAQAAHRDSEAKLLAMVQRAFAYARIFSETDPALARALDGFVLARPERQERKPKAERKKKNIKESDRGKPDVPAGELPFEGEHAQPS